MSLYIHVCNLYMGIFGTLSEDGQFDSYAVILLMNQSRCLAQNNITCISHRAAPPGKVSANVAIGEATGVATWGKCGETRGMGPSFDGLSHLLKMERGLNG